MDRRVRTFWVVRQRYHRAAWIATGIGGVVGLFLVALIVRLDLADGKLSAGGVVACIIVLAAFILVPRIVVLLMWRVARQRHYWEWQ